MTNRRDFLTVSTLAVAGAALGGPLFAQAAPPQAPPVTRFEELRRGVGIFIGTGGTIGYLVNADGAIAVDSQFPQTAAPCVAGLKERAPKGIALLINTHHHGDHTGGNAVFKPAVKHIVAHEQCVAWQRKLAEQAGTTATQAFGDTTFADQWQTSFGGETVQAVYRGPGHTSGDVTVFFQNANVLHGGDLLFRRTHPRVDGPAGASIANWITILEKLASAHGGDTIFVFGHGKDNMTRGSVADVRYFRDYLSAALSHAQKALQAGQSKEEASKLTVLPGFEDVAQANPNLSLAGVLGAAYDESAKKQA